MITADCVTRHASKYWICVFIDSFWLLGPQGSDCEILFILMFKEERHMVVMGQCVSGSIQKRDVTHSVHQSEMNEWSKVVIYERIVIMINCQCRFMYLNMFL